VVFPGASQHLLLLLQALLSILHALDWHCAVLPRLQLVGEDPGRFEDAEGEEEAAAPGQPNGRS
jgi:hypothetical protein